MTHSHDHDGELLEARPIIPIIPPPFGVPPSWVELEGSIPNEAGQPADLHEELWVVGYLDPLLNEPAAGMPVVLTVLGALSLGTYVIRRRITNPSWRLVIQSPATLLQQQQQAMRAAQAAAGQRLHVAGPLGPTGRPL